MRFRGPLAAIACAAAAGCSAPAPKPTPVPPVARPAPSPTPTPPPPAPAAKWNDNPATAGDWFYRKGNGTTAALFGASGSDARFAVTCVLGQRRVTLARAGAASQSAPMTIRTEFGDRALTGVPSTEGLPSLVATLGSEDPLLDSIAFSKGRFAVEVAGQMPLYLPTWPEITRVIEDCR